MFKKSLCLILACVFLLCCYSAAMAANTVTRLYTAYGNGMLFEQNQPIILAGMAENGTEISASLLSADNKQISSAQTTAANGCFTLSFDGMAGGYDTYPIVLKANGKEFEKLESMSP